MLSLLTCFVLSLNTPQTELIQQKPVLILYYTPYCPFSRRVLSYLEQTHKKVPLVNLQNNAAGKEELKKVGGKLEVPCLIIDGQALYNDQAIIEWLQSNQNLLDSE